MLHVLRARLERRLVGWPEPSPKLVAGRDISCVIDAEKGVTDMDDFKLIDPGSSTRLAPFFRPKGFSLLTPSKT